MTSISLSDDLPQRTLSTRSHHPLVTSYAEVKSWEFESDNYLLENLIYPGSTGMVFGPRGLGKTWLSLTIAISVALGKKFEPFGKAQGVKTIYFDGEMRPETLKARVVLACEQFSKGSTENLLFVSAMRAAQEIGYLDREDHHQGILEIIGDAQFVVFDNLSAWTESGREDAMAFAVVKKLLTQLRRQQVAVLLVHHAGKRGTQRGTSMREDMLDFSIQLSATAGARPDNGVSFVMEMVKMRELVPGMDQPYCVTIQTVPADQSRVARLRVHAEPHNARALAPNAQQQRMLELHLEGRKQSEIAKELGVSISTVSRGLGKVTADSGA